MDWVEPAAGADKTQAYNLMIAGGDYPDLIFNSDIVNNAASHIENKVIIPLNDYLPDYAPNLWALMQGNADIDKAYNEGNPHAIVARDMYYNRVKKFVGAYAAEMGGVDLIVFTGGVGENSCEMREAVCTGLEFMGVKFDPAANKGARGVNKILSAADSKVKVATIATNEELVIATDTYNLVK